MGQLRHGVPAHAAHLHPRHGIQGLQPRPLLHPRLHPLEKAPLLRRARILHLAPLPLHPRGPLQEALHVRRSRHLPVPLPLPLRAAPPRHALLQRRPPATRIQLGKTKHRHLRPRRPRRPLHRLLHPRPQPRLALPRRQHRRELLPPSRLRRRARRRGTPPGRLLRVPRPARRAVRVRRALQHDAAPVPVPGERVEPAAGGRVRGGSRGADAVRGEVPRAVLRAQGDADPVGLLPRGAHTVLSPRDVRRVPHVFQRRRRLRAEDARTRRQPHRQAGGPRGALGFLNARRRGRLLLLPPRRAPLRGMGHRPHFRASDGWRRRGGSGNQGSIMGARCPCLGGRGGGGGRGAVRGAGGDFGGGRRRGGGGA
mmetsp:Transcript_22934/g.60876  ORF Transcript_22934/g.60876 Transcript_22934/m.60876 type:complete len:368 (-) Transcript_22934:439-1542(-)